MKSMENLSIINDTMNILHITDLHFGPNHWRQNDTLLLERLNAFDADVILNTGDMTTDSLEGEFEQAGEFLAQLDCKNVISIIGNHDKFSKRSHELFRQYIYDGSFILPKDRTKVCKKWIYMDDLRYRLDYNCNDVNHLHVVEINGEKILFIGLDTAMLHSHYGYVEPQILDALTDAMADLVYDRTLLLAHHSILASDEVPLTNGLRVTDFVAEHHIEAVFCGHTHELDIVEVKNLVKGTRYRQFMSGAASSRDNRIKDHMFCTYENFGKNDEVITVTRMLPKDGGLEFVETIIG